jgi:hypothetical protein
MAMKPIISRRLLLAGLWLAGACHRAALCADPLGQPALRIRRYLPIRGASQVMTILWGSARWWPPIVFDWTTFAAKAAACS